MIKWCEATHLRDDKADRRCVGGGPERQLDVPRGARLAIALDDGGLVVAIEGEPAAAVERRDSIRSNQKQSKAIRRNQTQSDAIRSNQKQPEVLRSNLERLCGEARSRSPQTSRSVARAQAARQQGSIRSQSSVVVETAAHTP